MTINTLEFSTKDFGAKSIAKNETLFTVANGYFGLRGDYEEQMGCYHKGTYINGFYDSEPITYGETAYAYAKNHETILNLPDPKYIEMEIEGELFNVSKGKFDSAFNLSFETGILTRTVTKEFASGVKIQLTTKRLVSFDQITCAAISYNVKVLELPSSTKSVNICIASGINTNSQNISAKEDPRVGAKFSSSPLKILGTNCTEENGFKQISFESETRNSGLLLCGTVLQNLAVFKGIVISHNFEKIENAPVSNWYLSLEENGELNLEKYFSYDTSDKKATVKILAKQSLANVTKFAKNGFNEICKKQSEYLESFWKTARINIEGNKEYEQAIHFNLFHLLQSAGKNGNSSIAAKGLTGEGYEGHFFWDTEAYVCPVFTYLKPEITNALLSFRQNKIDLAKQRAGEMALKGALFPWRTISGNETSAYFPAGTAQYHINADVTFAIQKYLNAIGGINQLPKDSLLTKSGIKEIAVETARMWLSLGSFIQEKGGAFCINEVTGPDEYSACVNNNSYTNLMARENLEFSVRIAEELKLTDKKEITEEELTLWKTAAEKMYIPFDKKTGIYLQDDAFLDRAEWDFENTPKESYPLLLHYHPLVIYRHKVLKQPDLVLAQFFLSGRFTRSEIIRNYNYYERLTTGDSSLSHCIQSIVSCQIPNIEKAVNYFSKTADMDIADVHGNTRDGIHIACMAGSWLALVYGFSGFRDYGKKWSFDPKLPEGWKKISYRMQIENCLVKIEYDDNKASYTLEETSIYGKKLTLTHRNEQFTLEKGQTKSFDLSYRLKAVLFDLDGVITDTAKFHYKAWKTISVQHGLTCTEEMNKQMTGRSRMDSLEYILKQNNATLSEEEKIAFAKEKNDLYCSFLEELTPADILPGISELLEELKAKGIKCILASASKNAPFILKKLDIEQYFAGIVNPDSLQKGKPESDIYIHAADLAGEWYTNCIGIEDAQSGINAIKGAGIKAIGIGTLLQNANLLLDTTAKIKDFIFKI